MKKINDIFEIIDKENIIYEEASLKNTHFKGIYFKVENLQPVIAIEESIVKYTSIYISILAEELGHHFTTQGNLLEPSKDYSEKLYKNKKEYLARKWACNFLISDAEFVQALLSSISNKYEMCEYFNITYDILENKIKSILKDEEKYIKIKSIFKIYEVQYNACNI
ncbi:ImmA/IrrE family metallo-endopeptidase [Clostridium tertium]